MSRIDPRYGTVHWKKLRRQILARDLWACWKCGQTADTCDHIERPEDRPDLFWEPSNLRASCRRDNLLRHHPARVVAGQGSPGKDPEKRNPLVVPFLPRKPQIY